MMPDTELTQRLLDAGVSTRGETIEETSPCSISCSPGDCR